MAHEYPDGLDAEWIAIDSAGHVAVFFTAGEGPIPDRAFAAMPELGEAPNFNTHQLPKVTHADRFLTDTGRELAELGLFVFDFVNAAQAYTIDASPKHPIAANELPEAFAKVANAVVFNDVDFASSTSLDVRSRFDCHENPSLWMPSFTRRGTVPRIPESTPMASIDPITSRQPRWIWLAIAALLLTLCTALGLIAGAWWAIRQLPATQTVVREQVSTPEVPLVMRTPGGLLEVATVRATERFSRRDSKSFWGVDLGETVAEIAVPATYRFHIPLARQWPVRLHNGVAEVDAPAIAPSLPVAVDTTQMQTWGRNGWARFNKDDSLLALQRSLTPQLAERANNAHYRELATEAARATVAEYTRSWLTASGKGPVREVRVRFPGEAQATAPATGKSSRAASQADS